MFLYFRDKKNIWQQHLLAVPSSCRGKCFEWKWVEEHFQSFSRLEKVWESHHWPSPGKKNICSYRPQQNRDLLPAEGFNYLTISQGWNNYFTDHNFSQQDTFKYLTTTKHISKLKMIMIWSQINIFFQHNRSLYSAAILGYLVKVVYPKLVKRKEPGKGKKKTEDELAMALLQVRIQRPHY